MNSIKPLLLAASLLLSAGAWAEGGSDRALQHIQQIQQMRDKAAAALMQAEQAPAAQRKTAMGTHMQMLGEMLTQLHSSHPDQTMTAEQHLAWMEVHDKLMDDALGQMQREHQLMLGECDK